LVFYFIIFIQQKIINKKMQTTKTLIAAFMLMVIALPAQALTDPSSGQTTDQASSAPQVTTTTAPVSWVTNRSVARNAGIAYSKLNLFNSIVSTDILDHAIRKKDLKSNTIDSRKIVDNSVTSRDIKNGTINGKDIKNGTITGANLSSSISIATTGDIATTSGGTITSDGLLTANNGIDVRGTIYNGEDTGTDQIILGDGTDDNVYINDAFLSDLSGVIDIGDFNTMTDTISLNGDTTVDGNIIMNDAGNVITNNSNIVNIGDGTDDSIYLRGYTSVYGTLDVQDVITDSSDNVITIGDGTNDVIILDGNADVQGDLTGTGQLGTTGSRWSSIYANDISFDGTLDSDNADGNSSVAVNLGVGEDSAITIGDNSSDIVNITGNVGINGGVGIWSISNVGAAMFTSATSGGNAVLTDTTGSIDTTNILNNTITGSDLATDISFTTTGNIRSNDLRSDGDTIIGSGVGDLVTINGVVTAEENVTINADLVVNGNADADTFSVNGTSGKTASIVSGTCTLNFTNGVLTSTAGTCP